MDENAKYIKIAILVDELPPVFSGVGDYTDNLAKHLSRLNVETHIITRVSNLISPSDTIHPIIPGWKKNDFPVILNKIKELKPEYTLIQYCGYAFQKYAFPFQMIGLIKKLNDICKTAVFFHEVHGKKKPLAFKRWLNVTLQQMVVKRLHQLCDTTITSNPFYASLLEALYAKKAYVIRVGSNIPSENISDSDRRQLRKKLGLEGKFIVGTFGHSLRGLTQILEYIPYIRSQIPNSCFLIVGHIAERNKRELQQWEAKNPNQNFLLQTGRIEPRQVAKHLSIMDAYLMLEPINTNNVWTGTSTRSGTLAAAMMCGLPIIGTRGVKTDSFLSHEKNIYLLDEVSALSLSDALAKIKENPDLNKSLRANARRSFEEELDWGEIALQHKTLLLT